MYENFLVYLDSTKESKKTNKYVLVVQIEIKMFIRLKFVHISLLIKFQVLLRD